MANKISIATSKNQSERLRQFGVREDTADMVWRKNYDPTSESGCGESEQLCVMSYNTAKMLYGEEFVTPAWSLSRLLALMPKIIEPAPYENYYLNMAQECPLTDEYIVSYMPCWDLSDAIIRTRDNNPIEACVQMIERLKDNGCDINH